MSKGLLIFPIYTDIEADSSVNKKNKGIIQAFRKLNISIDIISCTSKGCFLNAELIYAYSTNRYVRWFQNRHWQYIVLANKINWKDYRFMWIRLGLLNFCKLFFFRRSKKQSQIQTILEYGAFPFYKELKGAVVLGIPFDYVLRTFLHKYISYAVTYCGQRSILKIPVIPIGNGIDIDVIPRLEKNQLQDGTFRILSVSTLQYWHGVDRLIRGIARIKKKGVKVHLNIIGWGPELENLKKIVKELEIEDTVQFSGYVVGKELDDAFVNADVAAGTLAMHRKGLQNDSSLKNREYCARGVPFFLSTHDADFSATLPYIKYVASDDSELDIAEIIQFHHELKGTHPEYLREMQEYAVNNLSWESKIKTVLAALDGSKRNKERGLLIFPIYTDIEADSSINKKNKGIVNAFEQLNTGFDVLSCTTKGCFLNDRLIYNYSANRYLRWFQNRYWQYISLRKKINWASYDFLWIRMGLLNFCKILFFDTIKRKSRLKIILEYGAFPYYKEMRGISRLQIPYDFMLRKLLHNYVSYAITYCGQEQILGIPVIPINNGIDVDAMPFVTKGTDDNGVFKIVSVSTLQSWHAIDRIIKGMAQAKQSGTKAELTVIGWGPELKRLKDLARSLNVKDEVKFAGFVVGKELDEVFNYADIAAGTLGMHRIGLTKVSSLKNREYCARGIPFFLSTPDSDFDETLPFIKYIEPGDGAVDIHGLSGFYNDLKNNHPGYSAEMNKFAKDQLSWVSKIKTVIDTLQL